MVKRSPYDPYEVAEQASQYLHLQLTASQQRFYQIVTRILPLLLTILLTALFFHLWQQGETQKLWWVVLAMAAPVMLLFIPSWPAIQIRKGLIVVSKQQGFTTRTRSFRVDPGSSFQAKLVFLQKSAYYNFYLVDPQGRRQKIFEIPVPPFCLRRHEKDRMLEVLQQYSLPAAPGHA